MIPQRLTKCLFLLIGFLALSPNSKAETNEQEVKVILRTIGHEFLLQLGDSTSRILPIEVLDGRYAIQFESEFSFEPDLLIFSAFKVLEDHQIGESYIVEVQKCESNQVVHSFIASLNERDMMAACQQRALPKACYVFYFTRIGNKLQAAVGTSTAMKSFYIILIVLVGAGAIFYVRKQRKKTRSNSNLINIGQFQFDQKGMTLTMKARSIELSGKESDLLFLLFTNENETIKRERILKEVWGDEGDYVGRTLDVFISKLRKKLEADSNLKIINIRGVGYRFVIN